MVGVSALGGAVQLGEDTEEVVDWNTDKPTEAAPRGTRGSGIWCRRPLNLRSCEISRVYLQHEV